MLTRILDTTLSFKKKCDDRISGSYFRVHRHQKFSFLHLYFFSDNDVS